MVRKIAEASYAANYGSSSSQGCVHGRWVQAVVNQGHRTRVKEFILSNSTVHFAGEPCESAEETRFAVHQTCSNDPRTTPARIPGQCVANSCSIQSTPVNDRRRRRISARTARLPQHTGDGFLQWAVPAIFTDNGSRFPSAKQKAREELLTYVKISMVLLPGRLHEATNYGRRFYMMVHDECY
ncbi:hypothetical protein M427DRAFT_376728 [Gonapodya prolifera JEL478]|uniref:Uncharacterized protein n=1 Tax=Gonapodya prolifera (strain JEL478) TaxID=1344416 RepID=A0A139AUU5_GONPJ|nr:hypothetical protein M427DRAFT_376728 [Gonapodya prolifera JEL478]|eukprot:KXS20502.1 hypothetical protein M427DRAFT_376728 [Gonapodya prolifera JEL478]